MGVFCFHGSHIYLKHIPKLSYVKRLFLTILRGKATKLSYKNIIRMNFKMKILDIMKVILQKGSWYLYIKLHWLQIYNSHIFEQFSLYNLNVEQFNMQIVNMVFQPTCVFYCKDVHDILMTIWVSHNNIFIKVYIQYTIINLVCLMFRSRGDSKTFNAGSQSIIPCIWAWSLTLGPSFWTEC